jgi:hypothetical protein
MSASVGSITYSLKLISLDNQALQHSPYDALSYTWGDLSRKHTIFCDGRELQIHHNLHEALPYLARRSSTLPIWIDAVCIDQTNEKEKVKQIRLMSDIYRNATRVWAWLGLAVEPGASVAVDVMLPRIEAASDKIKAAYEDKWFSPAELKLPELESPGWDAFDSLINHAWFGRLWVVQEATLAKELVFFYGDYHIDPGLLKKVVRKVSKLRSIRGDQDRLPSHFKGLLCKSESVFRCRDIYQHDQLHKANSRNHVATRVGLISESTSSHQCSDPKDQVFALLGFFTGGFDSEVLFDERTSADELYTQFVQCVLQRDDASWRSWDSMLHWAINTRGSGYGLPTWCPNLHVDVKTSERLFLVLTNADCQASCRSRSSQQGPTLREILIRGTIFDSTCEIGRSWAVLDHFKGSVVVELFTTFWYWEQKAAKLASSLGMKLPPASVAISQIVPCLSMSTSTRYLQDNKISSRKR